MDVVERSRFVSGEPLLDSQDGRSSKVVNVTSGTLTIQFDGLGHKYSYAYGPKGLAGLRHNHYALLCAIFVSIGGLEFGYDQGVVSGVFFFWYDTGLLSFTDCKRPSHERLSSPLANYPTTEGNNEYVLS